MPEAPCRSVLYEPSRPFAAFHQAAGRRRALAVCVLFALALTPAAAQSGLEVNYLGDLIIESAVAPQEMPDDGYWQWLAEHMVALQRYVADYDATKILLGHLASQIEAAEARRFDLLRIYYSWKSAADAATISVSPQALLSNEEQRQDLERSIRDWRQRQKDEIENRRNELHRLLDSAVKQKRRSGDARPWLIDMVQGLEQELELCELYLFEQAQLFGPREMQSAVRRIRDRYTIDPDLAQLLDAKARLADAADLDQEAREEFLRAGAIRDEGGLLAWYGRISPWLIPQGRLTVDSKATMLRAGIEGQAAVLMMAAQTQRLEALLALRDLLRRHPQSESVRRQVRQVELYWLKRIAAKLDRERRVTWDAFNQYLANRGFDTEVQDGWWQLVRDYSVAAWGLGLVGSAAAWWPGIDVPNDFARTASGQQVELARDQVAMMAILRLVRRGLTLAEVRSLQGAELNEHMEGRLTPKRAKQMALDIQRAFASIPELARLTSDDPFRFVEDVNSYFGRQYEAPVDAQYHWYEWAGDLMNVHSLLLFWGPGAVVSIDGELKAVELMGRSELAALSAEGRVRTVADRAFDLLGRYSSRVAVSGYNLDTVAAQIQRAGTFRWLGNLQDRSLRAIEGARVVGPLAATGAELTGTLLFWTGAFELASASGVPGATLLVEVLGSFDVGRRFWDAAAGARASPRHVLQRLDELTAEVEARTRWLAEREARLQQVGSRLDDAKAGGAAPRPTADAPDPVATTPPASIEEAIDHSLSSSSWALQTGDVLEAERSIAAANGLAAVGRESLEGASGRLAAGRTVVEGSTELLDDEVARLLREVDEAVEGRLAANIGDRPSPYAGESVGGGQPTAGGTQSVRETRQRSGSRPVTRQRGSSSSSSESPHTASAGPGRATGEDLVGRHLDGIDERVHSTLRSYRNVDDLEDLDELLDQLRDVRRVELAKANPNPERLRRIQELTYRAAMAREARRVIEGVRANRALASALKAPITDDEVEKVLKKMQEVGNAVDRANQARGFQQFLSDAPGGSLGPATEPGANPLFEVVVDGKRYLVKRLPTRQKAEAEVVGNALANELGLNAAATRMLPTEQSSFVITFEKKVGNSIEVVTEELGFATVFRPIDDFAVLDDMAEHHLWAALPEYADQRAYRALLADSDGHLRNIAIGRDGQVWVLDFDYANVSHNAGLFQVPNRRYASGEVANLVRDSVDAVPKGFRASQLYGWMLKADELVSHQQMRGMIQEIEGLMATDAPSQRFLEALTKHGIDESRAAEIYRVLKPRADALNEVLSDSRLFSNSRNTVAFLDLPAFDRPTRPAERWGRSDSFHLAAKRPAPFSWLHAA